MLKPIILKSQEITLDSLRKAEYKMVMLTDSMTRGSTKASRASALAVFNPLMMDLLIHPETFSYPFDSIKSLSKLTSPDGNIRIYSWAFRSIEDGTYKYFGILQSKNSKAKEFIRTGLLEIKYGNEEVINKELQPDEWYGAIYYQIIQKKVKKKMFYYLLGWHGNDRFTTKKVIDVLHFDPWNKPVFGAPTFLTDKKSNQFRVIFEYTAEAVMSLRYEKGKKMIVFDHLSPSSPSAKGQYRYYGPDFTYDGYRFKKGIWKYQRNLEMRNSRQ